MANESTLVFETELPIPFTVADATGIEKGALLKLTDPMTAIINSGVADNFAGIASSEKIASDGRTRLGVYRAGIFKVSLSGACTVGDALCTSSTANFVQQAPVTASGSKVIGFALETGATNETILMDLNIGAGAALS